MVEDYQFDVFLAHNSLDKEIVRKIYQQLTDKGVKCWLDEEQLLGGDSIQEKITQGILQSRTAVFFIGTQGSGKFQQGFELGALMKNFQENNVRMIPVLLPDMNKLPEDYLLLSDKINIAFSQEEDAKAIDDLLKAINAQDTFQECMGITDTHSAIGLDEAWAELTEQLALVDEKIMLKACMISLKNCQIEELELKGWCLARNYKRLKQCFLEEYPLNADDSWRIIEFIETLKILEDSTKAPLEQWQATYEHLFQQKDQKTSLPQKTEITSDHQPTCLIITVEKNSRKLWYIKGELLAKGKQENILLENDKIGVEYPDFDDIPEAINQYLNSLDENPRYYELIGSEDQIRIEIFLPMSELHRNLDQLMIEKKSMVCDEQIHLRCLERTKKRRRKNALKKGWGKLHSFLEKESSCLNALKILESLSGIGNWTEYRNQFSETDTLGLRLKEPLTQDISRFNEFFDTIFHCGFPVAFWYHNANPPAEAGFEEAFKKLFCKEKLNQRCHRLLYDSWVLRSNCHGEENEDKRKLKPGYYLGMLVEDPQILPMNKSY